MSQERLIKIGIEKTKFFDNNFDVLYEKYKEKALNMGHNSDLKLIKEHNKVIIYVVIYL